MRTSTAIAVHLLLSSALFAQSAWVVSPTDPAADFGDIQSAVDAAASGDTVILRPGSYANFSIDGKTLAVVADDGMQANVLGLPNGDAFVRVENLVRGQTVTLRGLRVISGQVFDGTVGVRLVDNAGTVWIEDTSVQMLNPFSLGIDEVHGVSIESCAAVFLVDCAVDAHRASEAISMRASSVYAYGGRFDGGPGGSDNAVPGTYFAGGDGARVDGGGLFAFGSSFAGGRGLDAVPFLCDPPTDGGHGIQMLDGQFTDLDVTLAGGTEGSGASCALPDGSGGLSVDLTGGNRSTVPGPARSLTANSPVYGGETLTLAYTGVPGELVFKAFAAATVPADYVAQFAGPALLGTPFFFRSQGVVPAGGTLVKSLSVVDFGVDAFTVFFQPIFIDVTTFEARIGGPSGVTAIASSFAP